MSSISARGGRPQPLLSPSKGPVHQTPFQRTLWTVARDAHGGGDRADARIMMRMIEAIDDGDYELLRQLSFALRPHYRERTGPVPVRRAEDLGSATSGASVAE